MEKNPTKQEVVLYLESGKSIIIDVAPLKLLFEQDPQVNPTEVYEDLMLAKESMYSALNPENAGKLIADVQQSNFTLTVICKMFKQMTWRAHNENS